VCLGTGVSLAFLPFRVLYVRTRCILFDCHVLCALNPFVKFARVRRVVVKLHNIFIYYSLLLLLLCRYGFLYIYSIRIRDFVMTASIMNYLHVLFFFKYTFENLKLKFPCYLLVLYNIIYLCVYDHVPA